MRNFKKSNLVRSGATSCFSAELFSEASRSGAKLVGILRPQLEQLRAKEIHVGDLGPVTRKDRKPPAQKSTIKAVSKRKRVEFTSSLPSL